MPRQGKRLRLRQWRLRNTSVEAHRRHSGYRLRRGMDRTITQHPVPELALLIRKTTAEVLAWTCGGMALSIVLQVIAGAVG